jgi:hypothetical protein
VVEPLALFLVALPVVRRDKPACCRECKSPTRKESESILAPSLAGVVVRRQSKRRQGYRWAGVIELRKTLIGALNPVSEGEGNTARCFEY